VPILGAMKTASSGGAFGVTRSIYYSGAVNPLAKHNRKWDVTEFIVNHFSKI